MMMGKLSFSLSHARVETYAVYAVVHCVFSTLRPVHPRVTKHPKIPRYCIFNAPGLRVAYSKESSAMLHPAPPVMEYRI